MTHDGKEIHFPRASQPLLPAGLVLRVSAVTAGGLSVAPRQLSYSVTHGPAGTSAQTGHDPHSHGGRAGRLASLLHRMASALRGRNRGADGAGQGLGHRAAIIGRRAERIHNHDPKGAAAYVDRHLILARGRV